MPTYKLFLDIAFVVNAVFLRSALFYLAIILVALDSSVYDACNGIDVLRSPPYSPYLFSSLVALKGVVSFPSNESVKERSVSRFAHAGNPYGVSICGVEGARFLMPRRESSA